MSDHKLVQEWLTYAQKTKRRLYMIFAEEKPYPDLRANSHSNGGGLEEAVAAMLDD